VIPTRVVWISWIPFLFLTFPLFPRGLYFFKPFLRYCPIRGKPASHTLSPPFTLTLFPDTWLPQWWMRLKVRKQIKGVLTPGFMSLSRWSNSRVSRFSGYVKTLILHGLYLSSEPSTASCPVKDTQLMVSTKFMLYEVGLPLLHMETHDLIIKTYWSHT